MARVAVIDDYPLYADMVVNMLRKNGHEAMADVTPLDLEKLRDFKPNVLVVSLVRKIEALGHDVSDFYREVDGAKSLIQLENTADFDILPVIISALAVEERHIPPEVRYDMYVDFPREIARLLRGVERLAKHPEAPSD